MHEQDVRRAVDRPGGLDSAPAQHTIDYLLEGMAMVLAKRAAAPPGSTLVVEVEGTTPAAFGISDTGRGGPLPDVPAEPTVRSGWTARRSWCSRAVGSPPTASAPLSQATPTWQTGS